MQEREQQEAEVRGCREEGEKERECSSNDSPDGPGCDRSWRKLDGQGWESSMELLWQTETPVQGLSQETG